LSSIPVDVKFVKVPVEVTVGWAASIFKVTSPVVPPPAKPVPATTEEISPVSSAPLFCSVPTIFTVSPDLPTVTVLAFSLIMLLLIMKMKKI